MTFRWVQWRVGTTSSDQGRCVGPGDGHPRTPLDVPTVVGLVKGSSSSDPIERPDLPLRCADLPWSAGLGDVPNVTVERAADTLGVPYP